MKKLWIRTGILFACAIAASLAADLGWLDALAAHPVGLAAYWIATLAFFLFMVFGVARPWMDHWSRSDAPLARMMTMMYRRRK